MKYNLKYKHKEDGKNDYLTGLLRSRGIKEEELEKFLMPTEDNLIDPLLLDHMEDGYNLLKKHLFSDDCFDLIVDSDMDGVTSAAEFYLFCKQVNPNKQIRYYIHDGKQHGLEDKIDELLSLDDCKFVICPDSSSNDYEYHSILKGCGIDILILDHHEADNGYSPYAITINNQLSQNYSNKALSGATVVYKYLCYCEKRLKEDNIVDLQGYSETLIDLAACGAIGDMMSVVTLENRYLFSKGLRSISNFGLKTLIDQQSFSLGDIENLTPIGIAFYVVPYVNALIRVGSYQEKITLFRAFIEGNTLIQSTKRGSKLGQMETIAAQNARNCTNAKNRQKREEDKALQYFDGIIQSEGLNDNKILIVENDRNDLNPNLTGLVAMQIMNKYHKPTILVKENTDGVLKGSLRANDKSELTNFRDFLVNSQLCEYAQGHACAAGVGFKKNNKQKLLEYANEKLKNIDFSEGVYNIDFELDNNTERSKEIITQMYNARTLFGQGNDEPLLLMKDIRLNKKDITVMGRTSDTIKFSYNGLEFIKFKATDFIKEMMNYNTLTLTVVGRGTINTFMGRDTPQVMIVDYEIKDDILEF